MRNRNLLILLALLAILVAGASEVFGACSPPKAFQTYNTFDNPGVYPYIRFGDPSGDPANLVGRFWQTGNFAAGNTGTYPVAEWLLDSYYYPGTDAWYLNGNLGDGRVAGCPTGSLTVEAFNTATNAWVAMTKAETPARAVVFDFSTYVDDFLSLNLRPTLSNVDQATRTVNVSVPDATGATYGTNITEIQVLRAFSSRTAPPAAGLAAGGWEVVGTVPAGGGTLQISTDCGDGSLNAYFASAPVVEGQAPDFVAGDYTQQECDPNLADPTKFKLIDRDNLGKGKKGRR